MEFIADMIVILFRKIEAKDRNFRNGRARCTDEISL
jgi:hypothetical protein